MRASTMPAYSLTAHLAYLPQFAQTHADEVAVFLLGLFLCLGLVYRAKRGHGRLFW